MTQSRSADPFSTFLSTADRRANVGDIVGNSAHPRRPAATPSLTETTLLTTLYARRDQDGTRVDELRRELGLSTVLFATALATLNQRGWVFMHSDGNEEKVELTSTGRAVAGSPRRSDDVPD